MTLSNRQYKDAIYDQLARLGKAVASPTRLELVDLLCQGPRTVESLARQAGQSVANTSKNLRLLHAARLVETARQGTYVTYRLAGEEVCDLFRTLRKLAELRLTEVEAITRDFLESRDTLEPVDREELIRRVHDGEALVLDVRPREEYETAHIAGALSAPLSELKDFLSELPQDKQIVAYCRGPYCVMSIDAVRLLREEGFEAVRLEDGVPDWRARGLAVEAAGAQP
ncbi:MAG: metalloregulator ArsR/SmtB family transcription factor [Acidobacteriota bacterium]|nr:metalloregulator ArsR/SmtB family transcription factor [Acidobacteriota bacterium]